MRIPGGRRGQEGWSGLELTEHYMRQLSSQKEEALPGESIFMEYQSYRKISDDNRDVVFDLFIETRFLQLISLLSNF